MISAAVVAQAADWIIRLDDDELSPVQRQREEAACLAWRALHPDHEQAWQRMRLLRHDLAKQAQHIPSDTAYAVVENVLVQKRRRRAIGRLLAFAGVGVVGAHVAPRLPWRVWTSQYQTAAGERRDLVLADGTRLLLNTRSAVDVHYTPQSRIVRLNEGEMLVATAQDAAGRPFIVDTPNGTITPIGTRFVVSQLTETDPDTDVSVIEGAVEIRPLNGGGTMQLLRHGEQTTFSRIQVDAAMPLNGLHTDWIDDLLVARNMRLADFLDVLGRYRHGVLSCDPSIADLRITGSFPLQDTDAVLRLLAHILPITISEHTRFWVRVMPAMPGRA